MTAANTKT
jgi:hypothetical protein